METSNNYIAGVDEVGRGPLAGPVVACAVILPKNHNISSLNDSKKISKKKREVIFDQINNIAISIGLGFVSPKIIDKINIRNATFSAMNKAVSSLTKSPKKLLIDGEELPNCKIKNEGIIKGDTKIESIMAASIIAKVTRDRIMINYSKIFPEYRFENNMGYGTKQHMDALKLYFATPIHRKSFNPVGNYLPTISWLKENNKVRWMAQKLVAIYLQKRGYLINKINFNINKKLCFDIYSIADKTNILVHINIIKYSVNQIDSINDYDDISNYFTINNEISKNWRIDIVNIDLHKKINNIEHNIFFRNNDKS